LYYNHYLPMDLPNASSVDRLVAEFERRKPHFFVLTDRNVEEFGAASFDAYAAPLHRYIDEHYLLRKSYADHLYLYERGR